MRRLALLLLFLLAAGCGPRLTPEQKATRAELQRALEDQSFTRAAELARRVIADFPNDHAGWERLAQAQLGLGDLEGAKETLARWRSTIAKPSWQREEVAGDIALRENDPARALDFWNKALAREKNPRPLRKIAQLRARQKEWPAAEAAWSDLIAVEDSGLARAERARVRRHLRRWPDAFEDSRHAQQLSPNDPEVRKTTTLFERVGKFIEAIQELDTRLAITPGDDQLLADRALLLLRSGDPELALADAETAAALAPWAMRPRLFQGLALIALERGTEAERLGVNPQTQLEVLTPEFLETIGRLDSEMSVERTNPELFVTRAWQLSEAGQPALAFQDAQSALRLDPQNAGAHAEMAYALAKLGRSDEAFAHIQRATEADPNFSTAWHYRGELEMGRDNYLAAIESFTRALAINQTTATLRKREECYIKLGRFEEAEADHRALEALR